MNERKWRPIGSVVSVVSCALTFGCGSDAVLAASVPSGPATAIVLRVGFYAPTLGTWIVDGFSDSLREQLAKYDVGVASSAAPGGTAVVTLGDWSDRAGVGRSIDVALSSDGGMTEAGRVRIPDLSMSTLNVASEYVAALIVRALRAPPNSPAETPGAHTE